MAKGETVAGSPNTDLRPQRTAGHNGTRVGVWTTRTTAAEGRESDEDEGPSWTDPPNAQALWRGVAAKQGRCRKSLTSGRDRQSQGASFIAVGLGGVVQNRWGVQNVAIDGDRF